MISRVIVYQTVKPIRVTWGAKQITLQKAVAIAGDHTHNQAASESIADTDYVLGNDTDDALKRWTWAVLRSILDTLYATTSAMATAIASAISNHSVLASAHHTRYTDAEAVTATAPTAVTNGDSHDHAGGDGAAIPASSINNPDMIDVTSDFADVAGVYTGELDYTNGPFQFINVPVGFTSVEITDIANPPAYPEAWAIMLYVYSNDVIDALQADTSLAGNPTALCTSGTLLDVLFESDLPNAPYTIVSYWPHYEA